jgi:nicotinate phosphoribosyltransferase
MDKRVDLAADQAAILDKLIALVHAAGAIEAQTDKYFTNTSRIVAANGDIEVTFAIFMRRRVVAALEPAIWCLMSRSGVWSKKEKWFRQNGNFSKLRDQ